MEINNTINNRIKTLRKELNLTQKEFAADLEIAYQFVGNIETGRQEPSFAFIKKLNSVFNASIDWLLTGQGDMFLPSTGSGSALPLNPPEGDLNLSNNRPTLRAINGSAKEPILDELDRENIHLTKYFNSLSKKKQLSLLMLLDIKDDKFFEEAVQYLEFKLFQEKKAEEGEKEKIVKKGEAG